jgi:type II secretory pathway pseudopilin PulG
VLASDERRSEQGFLLLGLVVAIFLILLALGVAAPKVAHELRREQEVETVRRGNAYVRAIEVYYLKMGHYPTSVEQLEKTNNIRFLRKRYLDPMTGKDDWRIIHLGEAKTTVKGFFGKPLGGIASTGLGSAAGMASPGGTGSAFGSSSPGSSGSTFGSNSSGLGTSGLSSSTPAGSAPGAPGATGAPGTAATTGTSGFGGQSGSDLTGTGGPIVGVGLVKEGNSIMTLNEQTTYPTWEFLYDPRIEQLKARVSLFGGGMTSTSATDLGSASSSKSNDINSLSNPGSNSGSQPGSGTSGSGTSSTPNPTNPTSNFPQ